jgi:hypothetical protein
MKQLKKYWWIVLLIVFLNCIIIGLIPIIINVCFNTTNKWFDAEWNANDALLYCGSAFSGLGTIFLGIITLIQTNRIKKIEEDRERANTKRPFFVIEDVTFSTNDPDKWGHGQNGFICTYEKPKYAYIKIVNVGDGVANNLVFEPYGFGEIKRKDRPNLCVLQNWCSTIPVSLSAKGTESYTQNLTVFYENLLGYAFSQKIELLVEFHPQIVAENIIDNIETHPEYNEVYKATVFNINSQQPLGMNKYDNIRGVYRQ